MDIADLSDNDSILDITSDDDDKLESRTQKKVTPQTVTLKQFFSINNNESRLNDGIKIADTKSINEGTDYEQAADDIMQKNLGNQQNPQIIPSNEKPRDSSFMNLPNLYDDNNDDDDNFVDSGLAENENNDHEDDIQSVEEIEARSNEIDGLVPDIHWNDAVDNNVVENATSGFVDEFCDVPDIYGDFDLSDFIPSAG